ncbi:hypothetical protein C0992_011893 [Termitomyces sp. T32_za158]|nr:hypothetical protein C0992_011893 [Termitomyces sp. T32_za158]
MARKPITYARKRNRGIGKPVPQTRSSPIATITNPDEEIATCEMQRRMLKRSRQTWKSHTSGGAENVEHLPKKPKPNGHRTHESPQAVTTVSSIPVDQHELRTPHNTGLAQEQVFKLGSSRGETLQSKEYELSPVPPALPLAFCNEQSFAARGLERKNLHKTSSCNLKENAIPEFSKLSSESKPNSSGSVFRQNSSKHTEKVKNKLFTQGMLASPFASKPSSPQQSSTLTLSSQVGSLQDCKTSLKRVLSDTHFNPNLPSHRTQTLSQAHSTSNSPTSRHEDELLKARRPSAPSATSQRPNVTAWFSSYSSATNIRDQILSSSADFFASCLGSHNLAVDFNRPPSQLSCNLDYDEAFFGDALEISTPFKPKGQHSSDSLFLNSPGAAERPDMDPGSDGRALHLSDVHVTRPLSLNPDIFGSWVTDSLISSPTLSQGRKPALTRAQSLDHEIDRLSDGKPLQPPAYLPFSQTKQVVVISGNEKRTGRDRRGTIRASDFPIAGSSILAGPRRTRSGTVVQGSTRPRRERSDTIVAKPYNLASSSCLPAPSMRAGDVTMSDSTGDSGRQGVDVAMATTEEQDDELLLKGNWIDEEWVVAAPPSPVLPRRRRKALTEWRRRFEQKKASGIWGMEHDPDNGEDDPLLLKSL